MTLKELTKEIQEDLTTEEQKEFYIIAIATAIITKPRKEHVDYTKSYIKKIMQKEDVELNEEELKQIKLICELIQDNIIIKSYQNLIESTESLNSINYD